MITPVRKLNKTSIPREMFKWLYTIASALYFAVEIIGSLMIEYNEIRGMLQDQNKEKLRDDQIELDRILSKLIPDYFSYWTLFRLFLIGSSSIAIFFIQ